MSAEENERIAALIRTFIEEGEFRMSGAEMSGAEEILAFRVVEMMETMSDAEKDCMIDTLIRAVHDETNHRPMFEQAVDNILIYAFNENFITAKQLLNSMILTCDFSLRSPISPVKISFIRQKLSLVDYKVVRLLFKVLLEKQTNVPEVISPEERRMLLPVEDLLLYIIDRKTNIFPALLATTEINRMIQQGKSQIIFPRVVAKATEMENSFRPLAEMAYVTSRSYMYPIPQHPAFSTTCNSWKIGISNAVMSHKVHLPYKVEFYSPQFYVVMMILKQPRGKDHLCTLMRGQSNQKVQLDNAMIVIIMETMVSAEKTPPSANRGTWNNILHTLISVLHQQWCSLHCFLSLLSANVHRTPYRKARDELMWVILQVIQVCCNIPVTEEIVQAISRIYSSLYDENETLMITSEVPSQMVRRLAAACTWIQLGKSTALPPPSPLLARQIEFIEEARKPNQDEGQLAIASNAYPSEHRNISLTLFNRVSNPESVAMISGRRMMNLFVPLSDELIESLGVGAQSQVLHRCLMDMKDRTDSLASPALVESVAKIISVLDVEMGLKMLASAFARAIPQGTSQECNIDYLHVLVELLAYRLCVLPLNKLRHNVIGGACQMLGSPVAQNNYALFTSIEQLIIRLWSWLPSIESIALFQLIVSSRKAVPMQHVFLHPSRDSPYPPELTRSVFLTYFRSCKIIGDVHSDTTGLLKEVYVWPESQLLSLCPSLAAAPNKGPDGSEDLGDLQARSHSAFLQLRGLPEANWIDNLNEFANNCTLFCAYFRYLYEGQEPRDDQICRMVDRMSVKNVIESTHSMVDFILFQALEKPLEMDEFFEASVPTLTRMLFESHIVPVDRVFSSIAMRPRTDIMCVASLNLVRLILKMPKFIDQLSAFAGLPRISSPEYMKKNVEYNQKFPERSCTLFSYYGNAMHRLLPSVDVIIERALELSITDAQLHEMLKAFLPLYKFHPYPLTYAYALLFSLHEHIGHTPRARQFLLSVIHDTSCLTQSFYAFDHRNLSPTLLAKEMVERLLLSIESLSDQPAFVAPDWRLAELPPAGQTLHATCCELMASYLTCDTMGPAFVSLLCGRQLARPLVELNAVAMILTALPFSYNHFLFDEIMRIYDTKALDDLSFEEAVFSNFEQNALLCCVSRVSAVLALSQAVWHHITIPAAVSFVEKFTEHISNKVKTEKELFFALHILIPLLQRLCDAKEKTQIEKCFNMVILTYEMVRNVCELCGLTRADVICDLLYHFKYMFVGDFVRDRIEELIGQMPSSIREKLKFIANLPEKKEE